MTICDLLKEKRDEILRICAKHGAGNVRVFRCPESPQHHYAVPVTHLPSLDVSADSAWERSSPAQVWLRNDSTPLSTNFTLSPAKKCL